MKSIVDPSALVIDLGAQKRPTVTCQHSPSICLEKSGRYEM
ncbi:hypothetical protein ACUOFC_59030, partial [Escherichia sp. TWPC-MK]